MEYRSQTGIRNPQHATHNTQLEFRHFVVDNQGIVFASARDRDNRIYNFLYNSQTGNILEQYNHHFEAISGKWAEYIKKKIEQYQGLVPTYRIPHFELS